MTKFFDGPKVDVVTGSGMLCVTIHPRPNWPMGLAALGSDVIFAALLYHVWSITPLSIRIVWLALLPLVLLSSAYEFFGEEVVEIDSQKIVIRKGIHGWERKRDYQIDDCCNLEWSAGRKGGSHLTCKVGRWPITFAKGISETDADEIFSALQRTLTAVAQKTCASTGGKEHFITLGLRR